MSVSNPANEAANAEKIEESRNVCNMIDEIIVVVRRMFSANAQV